MQKKKADSKKTIWLIIVQYWVPPIMTAVLGFSIGLYMKQVTDISADRREFLTRRANQAEVVAINFDQYIENWRRLIQIATYEKQKGRLDEIEEKRKSSFVISRNEARDKLFGALGALELYFGSRVLQKVADFRTWDDAQTIKRLDELPSLMEWRKHKTEIILAIRNEMEGHL